MSSENKTMTTKPLAAPAQAAVDKVIDKMVRITISDDREYVGKLMSIDKTKSIFLQDALELIDRSDKAEQEDRYLYHELFSPNLIANQEK